MLNTERMVAEAKSIARWETFDRPDVVFNLERLVHAINTETTITPVGERRLSLAGVHLLVNRLLLGRILEERPELRDADIGAAIIVVGLPRTGSTKLQRLIAQDSSLDHMKFWEVIFPLAYPDEKDNEVRTRLTAALERELGEPSLTAAHNLEAKEPEEELLLQKADFTVPNIRDHLDLPIWLDEMTRHDASGRYKMVRQFIAAHKSQRGKNGRSWIFKNAYAAEHLDVLAEVFPNAKFVFTHRDPLSQLGSITSLGWKYRQLYAPAADKVETGAEYLRYWSGFMQRTLRALDRLPEDRVMHVRYSDTVDNPMQVVRQIYEFTGLSLAPETEQAIVAYDNRNLQHKHGKHDYSLEEFGLTRDLVEAAYADYFSRFGDMVRRRPS